MNEMPQELLDEIFASLSDLLIECQPSPEELIIFVEDQYDYELSPEQAEQLIQEALEELERLRAELRAKEPDCYEE